MNTNTTTSHCVTVISTLTERQSLIKRLLAEDKITFEEALVLLIPGEDASQQRFYTPGPYDPPYKITC